MDLNPSMNDPVLVRPTRKRGSCYLQMVIALFILFLPSLCSAADYAADSSLELARTGGYAARSSAAVDDLDYGRDFSVEVVSKIDPYSIGGRWASFVQKSGDRALYLASEAGFALGTNQGISNHSGSSLRQRLATERAMWHLVRRASKDRFTQ